MGGRSRGTPPVSVKQQLLKTAAMRRPRTSEPASLRLRQPSGKTAEAPLSPAFMESVGRREGGGGRDDDLG